ncbi:uncharacterized protein N7459_004062 [Penicillium hispanicum]|uniref:uncharacterized protein n=1 Tax=Penicillium hispanicum TaxID=1080232 RepID=UPI0025410381|nr:uncharacterized protein N7459_004062 [Penicillium hispanicum]KAJ5584262.1 hypothetical protein N7459_004062 [Penicillium hispanicum]
MDSYTGENLRAYRHPFTVPEGPDPSSGPGQAGPMHQDQLGPTVTGQIGASDPLLYEPGTPAPLSACLPRRLVQKGCRKAGACPSQPSSDGDDSSRIRRDDCSLGV